MSAEFFYYVARKRSPTLSGKPLRKAPRGDPASGRIVKLSVGQGHGFIRVHDDRDVFFHRSDVREGTAFNDLQVGDVVAFELLEDSVSGARALSVRRRRP